MANFRGFYIPSLGATVSVAWETLKSKWPENSPCVELIRGATGGGGGGGGGGGDGGVVMGQGRTGQGQFKSFDEGGDNTEMMTMNGEQVYRDQNNAAVAEDSFSYQRNG